MSFPFASAKRAYIILLQGDKHITQQGTNCIMLATWESRRVEEQAPLNKTSFNTPETSRPIDRDQESRRWIPKQIGQLKKSSQKGLVMTPRQIWFNHLSPTILWSSLLLPWSCSNDLNKLNVFIQKQSKTPILIQTLTCVLCFGLYKGLLDPFRHVTTNKIT